MGDFPWGSVALVVVGLAIGLPMLRRVIWLRRGTDGLATDWVSMYGRAPVRECWVIFGLPGLTAIVLSIAGLGGLYLADEFDIPLPRLFMKIPGFLFFGGVFFLARMSLPYIPPADFWYPAWAREKLRELRRREAAERADRRQSHQGHHTEEMRQENGPGGIADQQD